MNTEAVSAAINAASNLGLTVMPAPNVVWSMIEAAVPSLTDQERFGEQVAGQSEIWPCGCGYPATEFRGEVLHLLNPVLTGSDDHEPDEDARQ